MLELEPSLVHEMDGLVGAIYAPEDQSGDAQRFTAALAGHAAARGVDLRFDCTASGLVRDAGGVRAVACGSTAIECDAVVVAAGVHSASLLRPLGLRLPIYPVKGYSASLPVGNPALAPSLSVTHAARRMVVTPLDGILRASGTVEIGGYDTAVNTRRAAAVMDGMRALFPEAGDYWQVTYWAGLRPMTPDGPPLLGATPIPNLYLNTGHGSLGWTLAAGSARVLADLLAGRETPLACSAPAPRRHSA
jgi:D-amino-acid dehydrogenase